MYTQIRARATLRTNRSGNELHPSAMPIAACGRATLGLGVLALIAAGCSGAWELLALQSPGTVLYIGMLPGPISALRELATVLGLLFVVAALWMPAAALVRARVPLSILVALLYAGGALALGAQLYAALHGMYGTQIVDMRADALPVFVAKHCGLLLLIAALLELARRALRSPS
jgi:hypothetical protein